MRKILITIISFVSLAYCAGGCILTQSNKINVSYSAYNNNLKKNIDEQFTNIKYIPISLEGKNFRELFVGSKIIIDTTSSKSLIPNIEAKIVNIKADKRVKGKPRTGNIELLTTINQRTLSIPMKYNYNKGYFQASGIIELKDFNIANNPLNKLNITFNTTIEALLCNVKVEK